MENTKYYRSLTRNMVLIMILVSFTPLVLISGIIGYRFETSYREKVLAHLRELVQKHQQNVNGFLNEKLAYIRVLADSYSFEQLSSVSFLHEELITVQKASGGGFVDLGLVDEHGVQVAYTGPFKLEKAKYGDAEWFKQSKERRYFISDVFLGLRAMPHFVVAVKQDRDGHPWILRATVDFVAFNNLVENIRIGHTGMAFILNRRGEFQTSTYADSPIKKSFFLSLVPEVEAIIDRPAEGQREDFSEANWKPAREKDEVVVAEGTNNSGVPCIYVMTPIKSGEWILVYQQEVADAFADLFNARKLAILIFLIGGCAIIIKAFLLSKRMVNRISQADHEKEMMNERVIEAGKLASLGELAAGIAHEINNPVAIMVEEAGWIEDLLEEEEFEQSTNLYEFRRSLGQIKTQGTRCREITHKLLSFARKTDHRVRMVQLNQVIEDVVALSEQRAKYSNVRILKKLAPDLPIISISPSEMQQVFLNLVNNALDALEARTAGIVEVCTRVEEGNIVIDVSDNGQGIPNDSLQRIFDPFFTTKPVGKGTGLGLSICYGIIRKRGGAINVISALGEGTTFQISIPISEQKGTQT